MSRLRCITDTVGVMPVGVAGHTLRRLTAAICCFLVLAGCPLPAWPETSPAAGPERGLRRLEGYGGGQAAAFWNRFPRRDEAVVARGAVRLCQFGGFTQMAINDWESTHPVRISEATTETLPIQSVCAELAGMDGRYKAVMRAFDIPAFAFMFWDGDTPTVLIYEEYDDRESVRWSTNDREAALIRALFRTFRSKPATRLHGTPQEGAEP